MANYFKKVLDFLFLLCYNTHVVLDRPLTQGSKTNRLRLTLFPEPLAASGFYGIEAQKMQVVALQFSIKIPTTEYLEEYSSGRRGVTRNFVVTLEPPTLNPLIYKGFARSEYNLIA